MLFVRLSPGIPGVMCGTSPVLAGSALTVIIIRTVAIFHGWQMTLTSQPLGGVARAEGRGQGRARRAAQGRSGQSLGAVLCRYLERNGYRLGDDTLSLRPTLRRNPTDWLAYRARSLHWTPVFRHVNFPHVCTEMPACLAWSVSVVVMCSLELWGTGAGQSKSNTYGYGSPMLASIVVHPSLLIGGGPAASKFVDVPRVMDADKRQIAAALIANQTPVNRRTITNVPSVEPDFIGT